MQRYFTKEKDNDYLILEQSDIHHIKNVMRNKIGDQIECIYKEILYICEIIDPSSPKVKIIETRTEVLLKMRNKFIKYFFFFLLATCLYSCKQNEIYYKFEPILHNEWSKNKEI